MSRTNPTGAKEGASLGMSLIPYAGDAKDIQEAVTGKELITIAREFILHKIYNCL